MEELRSRIAIMYGRLAAFKSLGDLAGQRGMTIDTLCLGLAGAFAKSLLWYVFVPRDQTWALVSLAASFDVPSLRALVVPTGGNVLMYPSVTDPELRIDLGKLVHQQLPPTPESKLKDQRRRGCLSESFEHVRPQVLPWS
jgi:hypothetical protein